MPGSYRDLVWQRNPILDAPPRYRRACKYQAFVPNRLSALKFALDAETAGSVSRAEQTISALNSGAHPALGPLARLLLRTESIASSKVEGLQLGARSLARAEARSVTGEKITPTAREIIANIDAMELAIEQAASNERFTVADILAIHERLMKASVTPSVAGKIRDEQNWVGGNDYNPCGADFVPPPPDEVRDLMGDLCKTINDDRFPPVVQAALIHAQFETIHPFADGNGRAGRALIHVVLKRRGLATSYVPPVSVVLARRRKAYIAGLTGFRGDSVVPWIGRFADAAAQAADLARGYLDAVIRKVEEWRAALERRGAPRSDAAAWQVIDALPAHPMITGPTAIAATRRARAAVYQALDQLEQAGVLLPVSETRRNKVWEAAGLLALLEGLEAGALPPRRNRCD
jgi:Fic family protein